MANFPPNESELVDQFIDALWRDPQASTPTGLDANLANFVRTLAQAEQVENIQEIQARVWKKSLIRARVTQYRQQSSNVNSGATPMISAFPKLKNDQKPQRGNFITVAFLAATAAIAVLISTSAFFRPSPQPGSSISQAAASSTPTAIPSSTLVPTATWVPTVVPPVGVVVQPADGLATVIPPAGFQLVPSPVNCDVTITTGTMDLWTATPIPATCPAFAVAVPAGTEMIQLDLRTLKEQKFTSPSETTGEITKDNPYAYFVYESEGDQNLDIVLTSAKSTDSTATTAQPDFSLIVFDEIDSVAYGIVMVPTGGEMFKSPNVYFDADSGAGRDPELNNIPFKKGHKYGIYVMQGKPNQFGKFTIRLSASTGN